MTGVLRGFTGPQMTAGHEQRIRELERRLSASQTNLPRRPAGAAVGFASFQAELFGTVVDNGTTAITGWTAFTNEIGVTVDGANLRVGADGLYTGMAVAWFGSNGGLGVRAVYLNTAVFQSAMEIPASTTRPATTFGPPTMTDRMDVSDPWFVNVAQHGAGAVNDVLVAVLITRLA